MALVSGSLRCCPGLLPSLYSLAFDHLVFDCYAKLVVS
uniref:Uncharacterized protein n=1 Tax=Rhizophora mucronata TaxID=61149 RepID=A0A2P2MHJ6_RHIMU